MRLNKHSGKTPVIVIVIIVVVVLIVLVAAASYPAIKAARDSARRRISINNLKQIGLALHMYHDSYRCVPPAVMVGEDGATKTSWRELLVPHMLYGYDDPNAGEVTEKSPDIYVSPFVSEEGMTPYVAVVAPNTVISSEGVTTFADVTDGSSRTLCVIEDVNNPVPWNAPQDISPEEFLKRCKEGDFPASGILMLMTDGSVQVVSPTSTEVIEALIYRNDGKTP